MSNTVLSVKVGDGATYGYGSDCYPATVVKVSASGKTVVVQDDHHTPTADSNYFGNQSYTYSPNPNGATMTARWSEKRKCFVANGTRVHVGHRRYYQDPSF